jgi:tagatose 1,6-diphosphate aldolase
MSAIRMTRGKFDRINACANEKGVIAAAAMDQRGSLQNTITKARGEGGSPATGDDLSAFKTAVTRVLTKHASAILMDPEYGLPSLESKAPGTGVLLAYEKTGYDATVKGRLPDLLSDWSVRRLLEAGADAIKLLLYYNPWDEKEVNIIKHAFLERIGSECAANDAPFFLEPIFYQDGVDDLELARRKPEAVIRYMEEFSKPRYGVDILKVEVPVNMKYVADTGAFGGTEVYSKEEARQLFRDAAAVSTKPFIYLSAGVSNEVFLETLELAIEAGTQFSGVLCGRATWQKGIPVYATKGADALSEWLEGEGVDNIEKLNRVLDHGAHPWWNAYGGVDQIEVVDLVVA